MLNGSNKKQPQYYSNGLLKLEPKLPLTKSPDFKMLHVTLHYLKYYKFDCIGKIYIKDFPDTKEYSWSKLRQYFLTKEYGEVLLNPKNSFLYFTTKFEIAHKAYLYYIFNDIPRDEWPKYVSDWELLLKNSKRRKKELLDFLEVTNVNQKGDSFNYVDLLIKIPSAVTLTDAIMLRFYRVIDIFINAELFAFVQQIFLYDKAKKNIDDIDYVEIVRNFQKEKFFTSDDLLCMCYRIHQAYLYYKCFFPDNQKKWPIFARKWHFLLFPLEKINETDVEEMETNFITVKLDNRSENFDFQQENSLSNMIRKETVEFPNKAYATRYSKPIKIKIENDFTQNTVEPKLGLSKIDFQIKKVDIPFNKFESYQGKSNPVRYVNKNKNSLSVKNSQIAPHFQKSFDTTVKNSSMQKDIQFQQSSLVKNKTHKLGKKKHHKNRNKHINPTTKNKYKKISKSLRKLENDLLNFRTKDHSDISKLNHLVNQFSFDREQSMSQLGFFPFLLQNIATAVLPFALTTFFIQFRASYIMLVKTLECFLEQALTLGFSSTCSLLKTASSLCVKIVGII
ncbi:hypothetical protein HANVADRAFT_1749 [Hanseniaspora valbyensis NRRL Y-1626]|uniref:Uncharacterized protein n=1 Tax=Hanseniaspora valbyensis NRRL Y-1626 TaxID=766949 RepID=A0A1B7TFX0_9ASCO|nr:hypothetical protein HANVADRAFT_1749 [Hanseniaspora valbyensis NRRL Y-1626]